MKEFKKKDFEGLKREEKMRMTQRGSYIIDDIDNGKLENLIVKHMAKHFKLDKEKLIE